MADILYEALYNRILDFTACTHTPLKLFAFYVIIRHTPPHLRHYSYFTLNTMFWNFLCNIVTTLMHFYPLFPVLCFRADGISRYFIDNEDLGYWLFILQPFLTTECALALMFTFPHRCIVFAYPRLAARIRPAWVFALCAAVHVLFGLLYFPIAIGWTVRLKNYPNMAALPDQLFVFCLHPDGMHNVAIISAYGAVIAVGIAVIVTSSFLFLKHAKSLQTRTIYADTLALQKTVFTSLIVLSAIAMLFGGIPIVFFVCAIIFPSTPYSRETVMVCMVILCNHGSISAIAFLASFKAYRDAVKRIFSNLITRLRGRRTKVVNVSVVRAKKK